jgi:hypothetical protein
MYGLVLTMTTSIARAQTTILYGITDSNHIVAYDPVLKTANPVKNTLLTQSSTSNSLALDPTRYLALQMQRLTYMTRLIDESFSLPTHNTRKQVFWWYTNLGTTTDSSNYGLYWWDTANANVNKIASNSGLGFPAIQSNPNNAFFWNDAYWYVRLRNG